MGEERETVEVSLVVINDETLSWKARGMLIYILTEPDGCVMSINHLIRVSANGKSSVRNGLAELQQAGYLATTISETSSGRKRVIEYRVFDEPIALGTSNVIRAYRSNQRHNDPRYGRWRTAILEEDPECEHCGAPATNAHHIYNYSDWPSRRFKLDNGAALCMRCHTAFHKRYGRRNTNPSQYAEWMTGR